MAPSSAAADGIRHAGGRHVELHDARAVAVAEAARAQLVEAAPCAHLRLEDKRHVFAVPAPVRAQVHGIGRALPQLAGALQDGVARPELKLVGRDAAKGGFEDGIDVHMVIQRGLDVFAPRLRVGPGRAHHPDDLYDLGNQNPAARDQGRAFDLGREPFHLRRHEHETALPHAPAQLIRHTGPELLSAEFPVIVPDLRWAHVGLLHDFHHGQERTAGPAGARCL